MALTTVNTAVDLAVLNRSKGDCTDCGARIALGDPEAIWIGNGDEAICGRCKDQRIKNRQPINHYVPPSQAIQAGLSATA